MNKKIQPKLFEIEITDSIGTVIKAYSVNKQNIKLNSCKTTHPAWTKGTHIVATDSKKIKKLTTFF